MSDLFHELLEPSFIDSVIGVMAEASQHVFQVLTKRPETALGLFNSDAIRSFPENAWLGVSIENSRFTWRADVLREIPVATRFISAEPLLGSLFETGSNRKSLDLTAIDWLIAGGESGPHARPMHIDWARQLRDRCRSAGVPFFFKQWGGRTAKAGGRTLDHRTHDEMPELGSSLRLFATG